jgi:oligopeptide transport system ATP-binding protein
MTPLLEVKNLKVIFNTMAGVVKAVDGVSYYIDEGEVVGLVGESGCGKSVSQLSVLQLIATPPGEIVSGEVIFEGQDLLQYKADSNQMRVIRGGKIAMIFQEPMTSFNPVFSIGEQIMETLVLHLKLNRQDAKQKAIELLEQVGIPDAKVRVNNYPHQFSGGMRQRAMIAMALSCNPSFVVCDEPISALDVSIQAQIINLLQELQKKLGLTYLLIAHDLSVVRHVSDVIAVMYLGHIVEITDWKELYENPLMPYTQALLSAIPIPDPPVERKRERIILKGEVPSPLNPPSVCPFHPRCWMAVPDCSKELPQLRQIKPNHMVACIRV